MSEEPMEPWEQQEVTAAGDAAGAIGGRAANDGRDPAERPVAEAGEGVSEGFELSEQDLITSAGNAEGGASPLRDPFNSEPEQARAGVYSEADHERSSEATGEDR